MTKMNWDKFNRDQRANKPDPDGYWLRMQHSYDADKRCERRKRRKARRLPPGLSQWEKFLRRERKRQQAIH